MTIQTSLLILPPHEVQAFAAPLRERHAALSFAQGPAHITLVYPFVAPSEAAAAIPRLTDLCADLLAFEVTLDRYGSFPGTIYLQPRDPSGLLSLHRRLLDAFPSYLPYQGAFGAQMVPHLTLARVPPDSDIDLPPAPSFTFAVDCLHLYAGDPEVRAPWLPLAIVPLGTSR